VNGSGAAKNELSISTRASSLLRGTTAPEYKHKGGTFNNENLQHRAVAESLLMQGPDNH
jgi:hypothetical protein